MTKTIKQNMKDRLLSVITGMAQASDCAMCKKMEWEKNCPLVGRDDEEDDPFTSAARTSDCRDYIKTNMTRIVGQ